MFSPLFPLANSRRIRMAGRLAAVLCILVAVPAMAQSVSDDPDFQDFRAIDQMTQGQAPSPDALADDSLPSDYAAPSAFGARELPRPRVVEMVDQIPICSIIDIESDTMDPAERATLSQAVWNEFRRTQHTRLQELSVTRRILSKKNLTPTDPYRPAPSRQQIAAALQADYLIIGNANVAGNVCVMELMLYHAASNSIHFSKALYSKTGLEGLLPQVPEAIGEMQRRIPRILLNMGQNRIVPVGTEPSMASTPDEALKREIAQLRLENDHLREMSRNGKSRARSSYAPATLEKPSAYREASALAQPRSSHKKKATMKNRAARPIPTPTRKPKPATPTPEPTEAPTPEPTATPVPPEPTPAAEKAGGPEVTEPVVQDAAEPADDVQADEKAAAAEKESEAVAEEKPEAAKSEHVQLELEKPAKAETAPSETHGAEAEKPAEPTEATAPEAAAAEAKPDATESTATDAETAKAKFEESAKYPGKSQSGIDLLEEAVRLDPGNPKYQRALVTRLYFSGQYSACAKRGEEFVDGGTNDTDMNLFIGAAYSELTQYDKAIRAIDRVLALDPSNHYAMYNRALNLYHMQDPSASEAFRKYLRVSKDDPAQARWIPDAEERLQELDNKGSAKP
jgi:tetratricopeptide (TPR) repeat protein